MEKFEIFLSFPFAFFFLFSFFLFFFKCAFPENIHTPPRHHFPGGGGGSSVRLNNLKKCMKLNWNFQRGEGSWKKNPSVGEVWIFSGTTQYLVKSWVFGVL